MKYFVISFIIFGLTGAFAQQQVNLYSYQNKSLKAIPYDAWSNKGCMENESVDKL